jgi:formylglycine-generating enzyme required for sulfatase activity
MTVFDWTYQKPIGTVAWIVHRAPMFFERSGHERDFRNRYTEHLAKISEFEFEVAISFAGEQRDDARKIAERLRAVGLMVFFDEYVQADLWGKDLQEHLSDVYQRKARFCLMLISRAYAEKMWPTHERRNALARAITQKQEYVLPVRFDETDLPGLLPTVSYVRMKDLGAEGVAELVLAKVRANERGSAAAAPVDASADSKKRPNRKVLWVIATLLAMAVIVLAFYRWNSPLGQKSDAPSRASEGFRAGEARIGSKDQLDYIWIPEGTFQMGCSEADQECQSSEKPAHTVTISKGFWIGQTEVTQRAYRMLTGEAPSHFKGDDLPVENLTWTEARRFCEIAGKRLPTEAEWEYAARGRRVEPRYGNINLIAWYVKNSQGTTHVVGTQVANAFGLKDVLGNVAEWAADWYAPYAGAPAIDPRGPPAGRNRVVRGESWRGPANWVRVSARGDYEPSGRSDILGVRCAGETP